MDIHPVLPVVYGVRDFFDAHPWVLITIIAHLVILGAVAYMILLERKVASWVQDRIGPNRVGLGFGVIPWLKDKHMMGLGQPLADGVKFILKEDYAGKNVDHVLFTLAPMMMIVVVILSIAVLPWGGIKQTTRDIDLASWTAAQQPEQSPAEIDRLIHAYLPVDANTITHAEHVEGQQDNGVWTQHLIAHVTYRYNFQTATLNIGVLFVLAALSLAVYGVVIGGWASNNKYSFLGGLRATANMISYEIPLGLAVLCVVILFGTLNLEDIVNKQAYLWWGIVPAWNIFSQPLSFVLFLICIHAEANRAPFDLAEAEQELVGGYHTEYSSMRFALFFLGEYAGMVTTSVVCVALFFGGWEFPGIDWLVTHAINLVNPHAGAWYDPQNPAVTNSLIVCIVRALVFFTKTMVIIFVFMWTRWSLPRFRFDQLMNLAWRALIPISLALLLTTAIVVFLFDGAPGPNDWLHAHQVIPLLVANVVLGFLIMIVGAMLPKGPDTNRKIKVPGSRYHNTPLPAVLNN